MKGYNRLVKWSIFVIYLVILAGAVVRMSGSGMGCPDWPKCFGEYIPPTSADELPANYLEHYSEKRKKKNEKLAAYLEKLGAADLAYAISKDESVYEEEEFNVWKTYTEYVNRLIGAISGLFLLALFIWSFRLFKRNGKLLLYSSMLLVAIFFQAWFGSIVVSTNLLPGTISIHMFLALVIVILLLHLEKQSRVEQLSGSTKFPLLFKLLIIGLVLSLIQIIIGTQVRQEVDMIARSFGHVNRGSWIAELTGVFYFHRSFSLVVLGLNAFIAFRLFKAGFKKVGYLSLLILLSVEVMTGAVMAYFDIPKALQATHLFLAAIAFGVQYWMMINFRQIEPNESSQ